MILFCRQYKNRLTEQSSRYKIYNSAFCALGEAKGWGKYLTSFIDLDLSKGKDVISKHIYGHFLEHLGRCIYNGLWVGDDSLIPNLRWPASTNLKVGNFRKKYSF